MNRRARQQARDLAFQTLFELENHPVSSLGDVLAYRVRELEEDSSQTSLPGSVDFAARLVRGVVLHRQPIDERIGALASAFPIDQMPSTDRVALELAVEEIQFGYGTPIGAVINEAVELAKTYGGENSGRFVNGVLGTIAGELIATPHTDQVGNPGREVKRVHRQQKSDQEEESGSGSD